MEKRIKKQALPLVAIVLVAGIVLGIMATNTTAALTTAETNFKVGDTFTMKTTDVQGGSPQNGTYTVVGEESIDGFLCSKINMASTESSIDPQMLNYTVTVTVWFLKNSVISFRSGIKSETTYSYTYLNSYDNITSIGSGRYVMTATRSGTRTSMSSGDSWEQSVFEKSESTSTYGNTTNNYTDYNNYTEKYTVIYDSKSVTVPAGTFSCYVINSSRNDTTSYYIDYISGKWPVKTEYYSRNYTTGLYEVSSVTELVSYSSATSATSATATKGFTPGFEFAFLISACVTAIFLERRRRR